MSLELSSVPEPEGSIAYDENWNDIFCIRDEEELISDSDLDYDGTSSPQWETDSNSEEEDIGPAIQVQRTQLL